MIVNIVYGDPSRSKWYLAVYNVHKLYFLYYNYITDGTDWNVVPILREKINPYPTHLIAINLLSADKKQPNFMDLLQYTNAKIIHK